MYPRLVIVQAADSAFNESAASEALKRKWCQVHLEKSELEPGTNYGWLSLKNNAKVGSTLATGASVANYNRQLVPLFNKETGEARRNENGTPQFTYRCVNVAEVATMRSLEETYVEVEKLIEAGVEDAVIKENVE